MTATPASTASTRKSSSFREPTKSAQNADCRPLVDLTRASDLLDEAVVHDRDPVAHRECLFLVVGHVDERRPELVLNSLQLELELLAQLDVEGTERLVEEEGGGTIDERARQGYTLLLSTRELRRAALLVPFELDHSGISFTLERCSSFPSFFSLRPKATLS